MVTRALQSFEHRDLTNCIDHSLKKALYEHHRKWRETALSCETLDVAAINEGVELIYLLAGLPLPERVIWVESPFAGAIAASILEKRYENVYLQVWHKPLEAMTQRLWQVAKETDSMPFWVEVQNYIHSYTGFVEQVLVRPIRTQIQEQLEVKFSRLRTPGLRTPGLNYQARQVFTEDTWAYIFARIEQQMQDEDFALLSRLNLDQSFVTSVSRKSWYCGLGGQDADSIELLSFAELMGVDLPASRGILKMARHCGWWWAFDKVCVVTFRPLRILLDNLDRLHCDNGPALEYADGWTVYARHGRFVPGRVADFFYRKNLKEIESEGNVEIRRHLIEIYGVEQYLKDAEAVKIHEDSFGSLYRKDFLHDEPLMMVKVLNSTPEPDGTKRFYYLRVPPTVRTAKEAVAWTFGIDPSEYAPIVET